MRSLTWAQVRVQMRADYFILLYFIFLQYRCWRTKEWWNYAGIIFVLFYAVIIFGVSYLFTCSRFDATDGWVTTEHLHLCFIRAISLIAGRLPGSDTVLINTLNSVVSFPSFSLISSYFLSADVSEVASPSGLQVAFSAIMWFHVPAAAANSIPPHCRRVCKTHKDYFPTFSRQKKKRERINVQLGDVRKLLLQVPSLKSVCDGKKTESTDYFSRNNKVSKQKD